MPEISVSKWLSEQPAMQSAAARRRVYVAMERIPNVLERQVVAHQKTLEQKISEQGPPGQHVDPHLLGLAIKELCVSRRIITAHRHPSANNPFYANARTPQSLVDDRLQEIAPLYAAVAQGAFPNRIGDALEIVTQNSLLALQEKHPRYSFNGFFDLSAALNRQGRVPKQEPPDQISGNHCLKRADFHLHGFDSGPAIIECKNYREWLYPRSGEIRDLLSKALALRATPILVARRIHYTAVTHLLAPAGIVTHETYHQYYPPEDHELAERVRDKRSLGFTDVKASYEPTARTRRFFVKTLPTLIDDAAKRFQGHRTALEDYASGEIELQRLYEIIGSPAGGGSLDLDLPF